MGKNPWISILKSRCRDLFTKNKNKCVEAIKEEEEGPFPDLSQDILIDIFTRLPAKCIFHLWLKLQQTDFIGLTTTPYFRRTHLDRATPTIVVQSRKDGYHDIKFFLKAGQVEATSLNFSVFNTYCEDPITLWGSYDGFLLFKYEYGANSVSCIVNPVTEEQVILTSPDNHFQVCGFYFHPRKKEYEVVCVRMLPDERTWEFQILSLRTKRRRSIGTCSYPPRQERSPVFINGTFYWMVDAFREKFVILSFNIETEDFSTMEAVIPSNYDPRLFQLLELEGDLSLFDPSSSTEVVIWVFNYSTKSWDKKHSIPSPDYKYHWDFHKYFSHIECINKEGEFIAYRRFNGKYPSRIYNLRLGTWKLYKSLGLEDNTRSLTAKIHTHSLVSLDAGDSLISI